MNTLRGRIQECKRLEDAYMFERWGLMDAEFGKGKTRGKFLTGEKLAHYERGYKDGVVMLKIEKGVKCKPSAI